MLPLIFAAPLLVPTLQVPLPSGIWTAHLDVSGSTELADGGLGADLTFGLELQHTDQGWTAFLVNQPERIEVPDVQWDGEQLVLEMAHYDSRIRARLTDENTLRGEWEKVRGKDRVARVPFHAVRGAATPRRLPTVQPRSVAGRWAVDFSSDELPSVAIFTQTGRAVRGTVLTHTGDYRFLSGEVVGKRLLLSCFDGAHAFLFDAEIGEDGSLQGSFRSGNWWRETWSAVRDEEASLGDAFEQTVWRPGASLADYAFPDIDGNLRSLIDPELFGRATILQLFGSWCPNCHDETRYLVELHERYADRGLRIIGLAFELTGERVRDTQQLRVFRERYKVPYPLLLAGTADKGEATQAFPAIDRLRSYPTTIFFDGNGKLRALHSGFAGPATGDEHAGLRHHYEALIEDLLAESRLSEEALWSELKDKAPWRSLLAAPEDPGTIFRDSERGDRVAQSGPSPAGQEFVTLRAETIWSAGRALRFDRTQGLLVDPVDYASGLSHDGSRARAGMTEAQIVEALTSETSDVNARIRAVFHARSLPAGSHSGQLLSNLSHPNMRLRRESLRTLVARKERASISDEIQDALRNDPDPIIRRLMADEVH